MYTAGFLQGAHHAAGENTRPDTCITKPKSDGFQTNYMFPAEAYSKD